MNKQKVEKKRRIDVGFWFCLLFMFAVALVMTKVEIGKEYTDFRTHSRWAVGEPMDPKFDKFYSYPVWHFCVKAVNWLLPIGREWSAAFVTACFLGAVGAILYLFVKKEMGEEWSPWKRTILTLSLLFVTALYMPWFNREIYLGQSSPTIWHNPTNLAVKPVALLCFLYFIKLYRERDKAQTALMASVSALLLLSCFIKPSFIQGFLPAVVIFLVLELIPNHGNSFMFSLKSALMFLPSGIYFLIQFFLMFGRTENREIGIRPFAVMNLDSPNPFISILLGIAFPLFVLVLLGRKKIFSDKPLWLALLFYVISLIEFILFIEETEPASGNFEWCLQLAMFILFVITAIRFYQNTWKKTWLRVMGNLLFLYHVMSGIWYYIWILIFSPWQC